MEAIVGCERRWSSRIGWAWICCSGFSEEVCCGCCFCCWVEEEEEEEDEEEEEEEEEYVERSWPIVILVLVLVLVFGIGGCELLLVEVKVAEEVGRGC